MAKQTKRKKPKDIYPKLFIVINEKVGRECDRYYLVKNKKEAQATALDIVKHFNEYESDYMRGMVKGFKENLADFILGHFCTKIKTKKELKEIIDLPEAIKESTTHNGLYHGKNINEQLSNLKREHSQIKQLKEDVELLDKIIDNDDGNLALSFLRYEYINCKIQFFDKIGE